MERVLGPSRSTEADATRAGLLWGALGVLAFSLSLPATRMAVAGGLPVGFVGIGRAALSGVLALLTVWAMGAPRPAWSMLPRFLIIVAGVVLGFPLLTAMALAEVPASHGIVVTGLLPASTAVAAVLRAGERPSRRFWIAAGAGVLCVLAFAAVQGAGRLEPADGWLLAAVVLCGFGYAEGGALARTMGGVLVICWALVLALPATAALTMVLWDGAALVRATPAAWAGFAYVTAIASFAGFFAWYRGLALGGVARVGQIQLAQPILALGWAWLLLDEALTWPMAATAAAVLACVVATQKAR